MNEHKYLYKSIRSGKIVFVKKPLKTNLSSIYWVKVSRDATSFPVEALRFLAEYVYMGIDQETERGFHDQN